MADMAVCSVDFHGQALGRLNNIEVIVPQAPGPFAVMYLLHGMGDDHTSWHRGMSMVRYVEELNLMVVMVNGARSFYTNDPRSGGSAYEDHVVKDVVGFVDATFPTVAKRQARGLAGYSMGAGQSQAGIQQNLGNQQIGISTNQANASLGQKPISSSIISRTISPAASGPSPYPRAM